MCDKGFIWNPNNCKCECDKSCDIEDYSNCKCRKKLVDKLIEEYTEDIDETGLDEKTWAENEHKCSSCAVYRVLFWIFFIFFIINVEIGIYFIYYKCMSRLIIHSTTGDFKEKNGEK